VVVPLPSLSVSPLVAVLLAALPVLLAALLVLLTALSGLPAALLP
jgi:hypothetical protein